MTTPGDLASTTVWFPPGTWVDYFTGTTFTGPSSATLAVPLDRMPVFVRQGGIVPEQPSTAGSGPPHTLTFLVYPGATGSFDLYGDAGTGLAYTKRQRTETRIPTSSSAPAGGQAVGPASPSMLPGATTPGEPTSQLTTTIEMVDITRPDHVTLDGRDAGHRNERVSDPRWSLPGVHGHAHRGHRIAARRSQRGRRGGGIDNRRARPADGFLLPLVLAGCHPRLIEAWSPGHYARRAMAGCTSQVASCG